MTLGLLCPAIGGYHTCPEALIRLHELSRVLVTIKRAYTCPEALILSCSLLELLRVLVTIVWNTPVMKNYLALYNNFGAHRHIPILKHI